MKINDTRKTKDILVCCGLDKITAKYFLESVKYCMDNNIDILDINMQGRIYPYLSTKFKSLTPDQIKHSMLEGLHKAKKETPSIVYQDLFNYEGYLTVKKLLVLTLMKLRGMRE